MGWGELLTVHPSDFELVEPRADVLVESLRAFGYGTDTAIADLVDNSVAAGASEIQVHFHWNGPDSWIMVSDDGRGMTEDDLREAMRPGSANPLHTRDPSDLGRFGLGLKTASFSQCRCLVVISAASSGRVASRSWDLDVIGASGQWRLSKQTRPEDIELWRRFNPSGSGTVVVWRRLDRLVDPRSPASEVSEKFFYSVADRVVEHLRTTFHRFLRGVRRVSLRVNGRSLKPWDPFLEDSPGTQSLGDEALSYRGEVIRVRSFVLPHVTRLRAEKYRQAQGRRGWTSQQGFYVYRNRRLIVSGDWLALGFARDEATKLARIQLDLPNTMDQDWQIDVRKSVARPPAALAPQLRRVAEVARRASIQVYRHRGKVVERAHPGDVSYAWEQVLRGGKISYRINRSHPLVAALLHGDGAGGVETLLRLVEETVPVPLIVLDHASGGSRQAEPFEDVASDDVRAVLRGVIQALRRGGLGPDEAIQRMRSMEPFAALPGVVAEVVEEEFR